MGRHLSEPGGSFIPIRSTLLWQLWVELARVHPCVHAQQWRPCSFLSRPVLRRISDLCRGLPSSFHPGPRHPRDCEPSEINSVNAETSPSWFLGRAGLREEASRRRARCGQGRRGCGHPGGAGGIGAGKSRSTVVLETRSQVVRREVSHPGGGVSSGSSLGLQRVMGWRVFLRVRLLFLCRFLSLSLKDVGWATSSSSLAASQV